MDHDDEVVGRWLTRREMVALFGGAITAAVAAPRVRAEGSSVPPLSLPPGPAPALLPNCVVAPRQMEGPYFMDEKLNRSDIRSDPSNGAIKDGAPFELTLVITEVGAGAACAPLAGAMVDIWQCDAMGAYSDFNDPGFKTVGQKFLRGYQITDAQGRATFKTIYPGWYPDRTVHIHFKVRSTPSSIQGYEFTSQLYFDDALTDRVHAAGAYVAHAGTRTRNEKDFIFQRGGRELMLPVTSSDGAYAATFTIGVQKGPGEREQWGAPGGQPRG